MLMGIAAYAEHRGSTVTGVQHAIAAGRITLTADNLIDSDEADRQWQESTDFAATREGPTVVRRGPGGSPDEPPLKNPTEPVPGMTYTQARALREVYDAQKRKLDLQHRRGELMARSEVEETAFRLFRTLRDSAFNIPARLAGQLVGQTDEAAVYDLLDGELRRVFEGFAEGKAA